jgi:glutathione synthase/RimK-type ligase-like ATP-grasp enzyme
VASAIPDRSLEGAQDARAVIVGARSDPHVAAVLSHLDDARVLVVDVETLAAAEYFFDVGHELVIRMPGADVLRLSPDTAARGWIRRLASPEWQRGVVVESREAAEKTAWLTLLASILRTLGVRWLSPLDALVTLENKIAQYTAAAGLGVLVPKTVLASSSTAPQRALPGDVVVKPLGPGHFYDSSAAARVVFATQMASSRLSDLPLHSAPFLIQERLHVRRHLRVVTVGDRVWSAALDAGERPLDWRSDPDSHGAFHIVDGPSVVSDLALTVAGHLGLGYSSQDWVETREGPVFLDLNPSGQWLFLPESHGDAVSAAIARFLSGGVTTEASA